MINTKRPNTNDYTPVGFIEAKDGQGNYQNIDHIYDSEGNIVFQQGYLNEYDGADDFRIPAIGKPLIDYTIYGNTFQDGIPTPDNPIMPQGTGERTGNLWDEDYANISSNAIYRPLFVGDGVFTLSTNFKINNGITDIFLLSGNVSSGINSSINGAYEGKNITAQSVDGYITIAYRANARSSSGSLPYCKTMLNTGSTALPYEPYGYKLDISSGGTTTPIYLGEVETTRQVKKLVLTGEEGWEESQSGTNTFRARTMLIETNSDNERNGYCTHTKFVSTGYSSDAELCGTYQGWLYLRTNKTLTPDITAFKQCLAAQYAAGTPVTVWYVLATEQTGIVNEPIRKIGDYADSISMEQAGVQIPTLKRPNTTEIDITTSLPPSEVYAKYRGSKTQKYDLFLAANGDSFEAKNGQSLYIGDDI